MKPVARSFLTLLLAVGSAMISSCVRSDSDRPFLHFSAEKGWAGEPVAFAYDGSLYHLFYLMDQTGDFSDMAWGHAVSGNLIDWNHRPAAIAAGMIPNLSSGSVIVDSTQRNVFISFHDSPVPGEIISMVSTDSGNTWKVKDEHIQLPASEGRNIHNPSVIRDPVAQQWVLVMTSNKSVLFYVSDDLVSWSFSGEFEDLTSKSPHTWEKAQLLKMEMDSTSGASWILMVNMDGSPSGSSGIRYFVGKFENGQFAPVQNKELWMDYGKDCSSGIACSSSDAVIWIAWMNNWEYALSIPDKGWRGCMTLPRALFPNKEGKVLTLGSLPAADLPLWQDTASRMTDLTLFDNDIRTLPLMGEFPFEIDVSFDNKDRFAINKASEFGVRLITESGHALTVAYSNEFGCYYINREGVITEALNKREFNMMGATIRTADPVLDMKILVDRCSVELFASDGRVNITSLIFPDETFSRADFYAIGGKAKLLTASVANVAQE